MNESVASPTPVRTTLRLLIPLASIVALLLVLLGVIAGAGRWLLATDEGTLWLLQRLPMVQVKNYKGALLGDRWQADSLRVEWSGGRQWLLIEGLSAEGLRWQWRPHPQAWVGLQAKSLAARKLTVHTGPPSGQPMTLPANIAPPVQLSIDEVRIAEAAIEGLEPLTGLAASKLVLDPRPGAKHSVEKLALQGYGLSIEGALGLGNAAPLPLQAQASVRPSLEGDRPRWAATLQAGGSLQQLDLAGTLRGLPLADPTAKRGTPPAAPTLDLRAGLRPLQAWPLTSLNLQTEALDLSALQPQLPATRLSGKAELTGGDRGAPLKAMLALANTLPGRWNEHRLPLRQLDLEVSGQLDRRDRIDIGRFDLQLADATRSAGRLSGKASWQGHELTLETQLADVAPQNLDSRAAAMTLSGPFSARINGLPSPDGKAPAGAPAPLGGSWKLDLQGKLDGTPQAVHLALEGTADDNHFELARVRATTGNAVAELKARLARAPGGAAAPWQLTTAGTVTDFDPLPWWPGEGGGAWRKGPHQFSGSWQFDLRLPRDADRLPALQLAQRVAGNGKLSLKESMLAGVPLSADITLGYTTAAAPTPGSLRADLTLGGNQVQLEARGDPAGPGESDRWRVEVKAEALSALAPLFKLDPALAEWAPRQGSMAATLAADGRWPRLRVEGNARVSQLQAGKLEMARATASVRIDTGGSQAMQGQAELVGLVYDKQRADHLRAELSGTLADHKLEVSGAVPLAPPPMAEQMLGIQAQSGTRAQINAQGAWTADPAGGGRWKARIDQLFVGSWDGSAMAATSASAWAETRNLVAEMQFNADGKLVMLQAEPGRLRLADAAVLRWDAVLVDLRGAQPLIQLKADIEPFAVVPLLARAQPDMGWAGDLKLRAHVEVRAAERMDADIVFERAEGDLHLNTAEGMQLLGLTEAKLALTAHDGVWNFVPAFRGRSIGDLSGQVRVQSTPERRWPQAEAALSGSLQAKVSDIGIWGAWVPPGWRLAGELRGAATLTGSFGAPKYNGDVTATKLGVRNLLQGVNISDGQLQMRLDGDSATIERFSVRGGEGSLDVTGGATLGSKPQARFQLKAERFRVINRVDRQIIASGNADIQLQSDSARIDGKFRIDEGLIDAKASDAPSLDDDVSVRHAGQKIEQRADAANAKPKFGLALGVDLDLGDDLRLRGYGIDTKLRGLLRLTTPAGRLAVNGTISTEGGTFAAYGQKLVIERGFVAFTGPLDNPRLDVLALRPNIDYRVGAQITGNLLTYRLRLYSEPEMSDNDKLSWLVLGRAPEGLGRNDTALLQRAAIALFSGEGEAPTDQLMKALGIDDVSLSQREGDVRETVVSIGKQLSRRWYLGYERGVNSTTGTWQLIYRVAQRLTVRMQSGLENALDVIWTWRFQETPSDAGMRKSTVTPP